MRNKKNYFYMVCVVFMVLFIPYTVKAEGEGNEQFFVYTEQVPQEITEFAKDNIQGFLISMEEIDLSTQKFFLGTPFKLSAQNAEDKDLYYFPVLCEDGTVKYTFRVYYTDGRLEAVLSKDMVTGLNEVKPFASEETPADIYAEGRKVVAEIGGSKFTIFTVEPTGMLDFFNIEKHSRGIKGKVNIINPISTSLPEYQGNGKVREQRAASHTLPTEIYETQEGTNWCAAYVTAFIISYKTGVETKAEQIMRWAYPDLGYIQLKDQPLGLSNTVNYAVSRGIYPAIAYYVLSDADVIYEIDSDSPVYLSCSYGSDSHAMAVRGYTPYVYSIWNPWYNYYSVISRGATSYVDAKGRTWTWYRTVWRWR